LTIHQCRLTETMNMSLMILLTLISRHNLIHTLRKAIHP